MLRVQMIVAAKILARYLHDSCYLIAILSTHWVQLLKWGTKLIVCYFLGRKYTSSVIWNSYVLNQIIGFGLSN